MSGGNKKVADAYTNLFNYAQPFCYNQALNLER